MNIVILMVVLISPGEGAITTHSQEFFSETTCEDAKRSLLLEPKMTNRVLYAKCVYK